MCIWFHHYVPSIIIYLCFLRIYVVTAQCIQTPYAYLAKRLTNTKVMWMRHLFEQFLLQLSQSYQTTQGLTEELIDL